MPSLQKLLHYVEELSEDCRGYFGRPQRLRVGAVSGFRRFHFEAGFQRLLQQSEMALAGHVLARAPVPESCRGHSDLLREVRRISAALVHRTAQTSCQFHFWFDRRFSSFWLRAASQVFASPLSFPEWEATDPHSNLQPQRLVT